MIRGPEGASFEVTAGGVKKFELGGTRNGVAPPAALKDRLYLVNVSGVPRFRPVYDALSRMGFYSLNPDRIRDSKRRIPESSWSATAAT
jgi:hypothetical protein